MQEVHDQAVVDALATVQAQLTTMQSQNADAVAQLASVHDRLRLLWAMGLVYACLALAILVLVVAWRIWARPAVTP